MASGESAATAAPVAKFAFSKVALALAAKAAPIASKFVTCSWSIPATAIQKVSNKLKYHSTNDNGSWQS